MATITNTNEYKPRPMTPDDKSYRDVMMLFSGHPVKPKYWFEDFGDYWSCSCGQINRDETCSNCGLSRELLKRIFLIQKPDNGVSHPSDPDAKTREYVDDIAAKPDDKSPSPAHPQDDEATSGDGDTETTGKGNADDILPIEEVQFRKRKRRTIVILLILIFLIMLLAAGLLGYYYYYLPRISAQHKATAEATTDTLSEELPAIMAPINDTSFDTYRNAGDKKYEEKEYVEAIDYYSKAVSIKADESVKQKILDCKYSYVSNNQETGGKTFDKYLKELKAAKYPGIENIYKRTYDWKASLVTNTGNSDYSTDMENINRVNTIYFHTTLSGGPPNEELDLYYELVWPDGTSERKDIYQSKASGETVTTRCEYTYPKASDEVKMTYRIYNKADDTLLATDSITLL